MKIEELALNEPIQKALREENYIDATAIQEKTIPVVLKGRDVIASAQTGTGKTAAFALPILQKLFAKQDEKRGRRVIKALIISPTRELAEQISESFKAYGKYTNLKSTVVYGGISIEPQKQKLDKGVDILIATPGRLLDLYKQGIARLGAVEILVLDEADMLLDMGFIDDVTKIEKICNEQKQTLLFSATMPPKVLQLANDVLKVPEKIEVAPTSSVTKQLNNNCIMFLLVKKWSCACTCLGIQLRGILSFLEELSLV